jgi:NitT/TauT family transport system substrate-binding protein
MSACLDWVARLACSAAVSCLLGGSASADALRLRIADSFGLTHLPIRIAVEKKFIESHALALGLGHVTVSLQRVGSGVVVGDLLLSGQVEVGVSGNVPLFLMADRTSGRQRILGVSALAKSNQFLISSDPRLRSLQDYGANDRIAMPEAKVSTYALTLELAAAKAFGWEQRKKFETISVAMPNADAAAAIISGGTEVRSHFTVLPYTAMELASGKAHVVLNSRDVVGAPYTSTAAIATQAFKDSNPTLFKAVTDGLAEAIAFINEHPNQAGEIFLKYEKYPGGLEPLVATIRGQTADALAFTATPSGTQAFTDVLARDGMLKRRPASWKDEWFPNVWTSPGS